MIRSVIAAVADNFVIGYQNKLPWHMPLDLQHFKQTTLNHSVIMGRRSYESIGKPLKDRRNIVITSQSYYQAPGCEVVPSLAAALALVQSEERVFITGGAVVYREAFNADWVDEIHLTRIHVLAEGDTYFPFMDWMRFEVVSSKFYPADTQNPYNCHIELFKRTLSLDQSS
jgi:dihydrofolate reductase